MLNDTLKMHSEKSKLCKSIQDKQLCFFSNNKIGKKKKRKEMERTYISRDLRNYKPIAMGGICLDPEPKSTMKKIFKDSQSNQKI